MSDATELIWSSLTRETLKYCVAIDEENYEWDAWDSDKFTELITSNKVIGRVAKIKDKVVGYLIYKKYTNRIEVVKFGVTKTKYRLSIIKGLTEELKKRLTIVRSLISLPVDEHDSEIHNFLYEECGYLCPQDKPVKYNAMPDGSDAFIFEYEEIDANLDSDEKDEEFQTDICKDDIILYNDGYDKKDDNDNNGCAPVPV